jgi:3-oxoacyl-[acyl-carrier protein] reductase
MSNTKKVFITGPSGGIGSAITKKFNEIGCNLILISSSEEKLIKMKNLYGGNHYYYHLDLSDLKNLTLKMNEIANDHPDISIVINNAGLTLDSLLIRMKLDQWQEVINTNLSSNFVIIKSILSNMIKNKDGKIIGISSVVALSGNPGQSNYVSSKSGMIGFYKSIAHEVASRNINVNVVSPGFIVSPMTEKLNEIQQNKILENIPMKKFGEPSDVANLVYFLTTKEASYITGQNFNVNGGMLMV